VEQRRGMLANLYILLAVGQVRAHPVKYDRGQTEISLEAVEQNTDLCPCGETQTMSHIVESCPLTRLNGGLSRLHSADEDAVSWLTNYGK